MSINPSGRCHCGCGGLAPLASSSWARRGYIAGEPMRYIPGHNARGRKAPIVICSVEECDIPSIARGWCSVHYASWHKHGDPLKGKRRFPSMLDRFWEKVEIMGSRECWPWLSAVNQDGYGLFRTKSYGPMTGAHRIMWMLVNGEIPIGLSVLHHCDNPPCVNPDHLFLGTQQDNIQDMMDKGRHVKAGHKRKVAT